eukprot:2241469-Rhodomonas_salina.1
MTFRARETEVHDEESDFSQSGWLFALGKVTFRGGGADTVGEKDGHKRTWRFAIRNLTFHCVESDF